MNRLSTNWNLDTLYSGGGQSEELTDLLESLAMDIERLKTKLEDLHEFESATHSIAFYHAIELLQSVERRLEEADEFAICLLEHDGNDQHVHGIKSTLVHLQKNKHMALDLLDNMLTSLPQSAWDDLLREGFGVEVAFYLDNRRNRAIERLAPAQERLTHDLALDGYHAWQELYRTLLQRMMIPWEDRGEVTRLSYFQTLGYMFHPDRSLRQKAFAHIETALEQEEVLFADVLNHLAGYRLQMYKHHGWDSVLQEPLAKENMSEQTLATMFDVVERNLDRIAPFFDAKAMWLGVDQIEGYDLYISATQYSKQIGYEEAAVHITKQFGEFHADLAAFAQRAFAEGWIDAEVRPGKRHGAFCANFPERRESRIMTQFYGNAMDVMNLAHELGHAYHNHVMHELPYLNQIRGNTVQETASTFAEMIAADGALRLAQTDAERLALLELKIQNAVQYLVLIHAFFQFEMAFLNERKTGYVCAARLKELMIEAQRRTTRDRWNSYTGYYWVIQHHFYDTGKPFYNFPYTFAYLFSAGVYARAVQEGSYHEQYVKLLRDTGRMSVEELAKTHLGVDLTEPAFWQETLDFVLADVEEYVRLSQKLQIEAMKKALFSAWSIETSSKWTADNPARGQCGVTALVVQDRLGGEILKTKVSEGWHFYNRMNGQRYDLTASQFAEPIAYMDVVTTRKEAFADTNAEQYDTLSRKTRLVFENFQ
jgi:oligoendopeptidase F